MKVMTVLGTRPEIIRLSCVMTALDRSMTQIVVHTGQNYDYELNQIFFEDLGLRKPDYFLDAAGTSAWETVGKIIDRTGWALVQEQPDALLVLGDTNSCLAAYPAKRCKIPIFHMEAGNRCFDQRVPEEINRRMVDHISDINMPYSEISRQYLLAEGFPADRIIKTGSPMYEVLHRYLPKIKNSDVMNRLGLVDQEYFLISAHREENIDNQFQLSKLVQILDGLAERFDLPVIVSTHPRTRKKLQESGVKLRSEIELLRPLCFTDYVCLQLHARATLSDSGTITEESSILNFPALNLRNAHERPEGMEEGSVMMTGMDLDRILEGLAVLVNQGRETNRTLQIVKDYVAPRVSEKVVRIILSYTDYVNHFVWHKG